MTLWAWSSVIRNSAFRTETTNSRGVKSSLTRMTLCSRGRSVLVLTLVFGLVTVSIIPVSTSLRLSLMKYNLRNGGGADYFTRASLQRRNRAQIGDYISQIGLFQPRIISIRHRRLERPPIAANAMGDGAPDFLIGPGADAGSRVRRDVGGGARWRSLG